MDLKHQWSIRIKGEMFYDYIHASNCRRVASKEVKAMTGKRVSHQELIFPLDNVKN